MNSYLIIGSILAKRIKKAEKIASVGLKSSSLDVIIVRPDETIGIDKIRKVKKFISQKPCTLISKIVFIPQAEKLTFQAQNAFLKTLEEPGKSTKIILTADFPDILLPTIISRCQIIRMGSKRIKINKVEKKGLLLFLKKTLSASPGLRIKLAQDYSKDKNSYQKLLKNLLITLEETLTQKTSVFPILMPKKQTIKTLNLIQESLNLLEKNINLNLVLDNFFLSLPRLKNTQIKNT